MDSEAVQLRSRSRRTAKRVSAAALSIAAHLSLLLVILPTLQHKPTPMEHEPIGVSLIDGALLASTPVAAPVPTPTPTPPAAAKPVEKPTPPKPIVRRAAARPAVEAAAVEPEPPGGAPTGTAVAELSEGELAGATTAGSGPAGRNCNMVRWLQTALRNDAKVQAAVAHAHRTSGPGSKAILMWKGEWIRREDQEGAGLAGVREAVMLGIAFAPEACRTEPVRGLVLISLNDAPGSARLALGSGEWRWSDLLIPRRGVVSETLSMR